MAPTEIIWKARPRKINGQSKPFIDKNLQIQVPDLDSSPVFLTKSKYTSLSSENYSFLRQELTALENELNNAISEAQQTHAAWKKMQAKLAQTTHQPNE